MRLSTNEYVVGIAHSASSSTWGDALSSDWVMDRLLFFVSKPALYTSVVRENNQILQDSPITDCVRLFRRGVAAR